MNVNLQRFTRTWPSGTAEGGGRGGGREKSIILLLLLYSVVIIREDLGLLTKVQKQKMTSGSRNYFVKI